MLVLKGASGGVGVWWMYLRWTTHWWITLPPHDCSCKNCPKSKVWMTTMLCLSGGQPRCGAYNIQRTLQYYVTSVWTPQKTTMLATQQLGTIHHILHLIKLVALKLRKGWSAALRLVEKEEEEVNQWKYGIWFQESKDIEEEVRLLLIRSWLVS